MSEPTLSLAECRRLVAQLRELRAENKHLAYAAEFWEERYNTQHRTLHSCEDALADARDRAAKAEAESVRLNDEATRAEAEVERLKDMNERIRQSFEEFRRAPWSVAERRSSQITEGISDEVVERAWRTFTWQGGLTSQGHDTRLRAMRAALEAVWPTPAEDDEQRELDEFCDGLRDRGLKPTGAAGLALIDDMRAEVRRLDVENELLRKVAANLGTTVHARGGAAPSSGNENPSSPEEPSEFGGGPWDRDLFKPVWDDPKVIERLAHWFADHHGFEFEWLEELGEQDDFRRYARAALRAALTPRKGE